MNSAYALPDMPQQVPLCGSAYSTSMPPSGSGSGPNSIHHSSFQNPLLPPPAHQSQVNSRPQSQVPASLHLHSHAHPQLPNLHHQVPVATDSEQSQHQEDQQPPLQRHLSNPRPSEPNLGALQQTHRHLHPPTAQLTHFSQSRPPSQSEHDAPEKAPVLPSAIHGPRSKVSSTPAANSIPLLVEQQSGHPKNILPFSKIDESTGRKYRLDVVQQPRRARMCGFGDKDRRPITPPPCVRLIITDMLSGKEVDCNDVDHSMFVLNVDLWNEEGSREVNLVRSSTNSPSISSTAPYSYPTLHTIDPQHVSYSQPVLASGREPAFTTPPSIGFSHDYPMQSTYAQTSATYPPNGAYGPPQQYFPQHQAYRSDGLPQLTSQMQFGRSNAPVATAYLQDQNSLTRMAMVGGQPQGMFTRNLIGSLAASAFRLADTQDQLGIWFVLQDLSVRTEGPFRFSFVNVGPRGGVPPDTNGLKVNTGRAPILASCFSEVFNVYSAKKFPGVCESTALSKTFATQGIKIPIRKDSNIKGADGEDDYGD